MKILYITRKYPPSVGGMEKVNSQLYTHLSKIAQTELIAWGGSQKWLPIVYPYLCLKGIIRAKVFKPDIIHLGDAMMSPAGLVIKKITGVKVSCTVHGLDVTFQFPGYQILIPFCLARLDKIICVSVATQKECLKRGVPKKKTTTIPNGINPGEYFIDQPKEKLRRKLEKQLELNLKDKKILLTIGRLVKRKGHEWFIGKVVPNLPKNVIYLIAGDGLEKGNIQKAIKEKRVEGRVLLLGRVTEETKKLLYNNASLLVMPNIKVKGDMEGFGIVALEASSCGLPVIASNIEGIKEAVKDKKNGYLTPSTSNQEFLKKIKKILDDPNQYNAISTSARKFCLSFSWNKIASQYFSVFNKTTALNWF